MRAWIIGAVLGAVLSTPAFAGCGGSTRILELASWGFIPAMVGEVVDVRFTYHGDRAMTGSDSEVLFTDSKGTEVRFPLDSHLALAPGASGSAKFEVAESDYRTMADEKLQAVVCTNNVEFADGGSVIIN